MLKNVVSVKVPRGVKERMERIKDRVDWLGDMRLIMRKLEREQRIFWLIMIKLAIFQKTLLQKT
jgi:hypothetical protein